MPTPLAQRVREQSRAAMLAALRRCSGDALDSGAWTGRAVDPRALALHACRPAMLRTATTQGVPSIGLAIIVDESGSMARSDAVAGTRLATAQATALGVSDAGRALGIPCALLTHGDRVRAYRTASAFSSRLPGGGNRDAIAVRSAHRLYERFASRILTVLVCDGAPCVERETHAATAAQVRAAMARRGDALLGLLIVQDAESAERMRLDWGAASVALATDPRAVTRATVAAIASMRA